MNMDSFFRTLLRPDREEEPERSEVATAANLLQIGEFQLLQLAYYGWHGEDMEAEVGDQVFRSYMLRSQIPAWARHYARQIIALDDRGTLNDRDPAYHRYDCDYYKAIPLGARRLAVAVACIALVVGGGILVGSLAPNEVNSVLPPYFNEKNITPPAAGSSPVDGDLRGS